MVNRNHEGIVKEENRRPARTERRKGEGRTNTLVTFATRNVLGIRHEAHEIRLGQVDAGAQKLPLIHLQKNINPTS